MSHTVIIGYTRTETLDEENTWYLDFSKQCSVLFDQLLSANGILRSRESREEEEMASATHLGEALFG